VGDGGWVMAMYSWCLVLYQVGFRVQKVKDKFCCFVILMRFMSVDNIGS
jgi:hypothetical protein